MRKKIKKKASKKPPITKGKGKASLDDFAGIWEGRDISLEKIRKESWERNK